MNIQDQRNHELEELRLRGITLNGTLSLHQSIADTSRFNHSGPVSAGLEASKVQYIKQMIFQYLSCREPEVKLHMESALIAIFRFSDAEKSIIEDRKKIEMQDTLSSITNFLGSLTIAGTNP